MRDRVLLALLLLLLALPLTALPAGAEPTSAVAAVTITDNGDCTVTVTYTWSGFKGRDLIAGSGVLWPGPAGTQWATPKVWTFGVSGTGTSSHTFDLTGYGSHAYSGEGVLLSQNANREIRGSRVVSPASVGLSC